MTKIKKRYTFDSMKLEAIMQSGATVKFSITRSGERLVSCLSNDINIAKAQTESLSVWIKRRDKESNRERFDRLEKVLSESNSVAELIANLK
jgi:hypothetical protein